jgi:anti-sigma B factor antagonist
VNITVEQYGHAVILNLKGELTEDSLPALKQAVDHQLAGKAEVIDVVLNMETTPFVDSASLEYMLTLQEMLNERLGQLRLAGCDDNMRKIFEITRLDANFETFKDATEAVKAMQP